jgi:hypothetical protein
MTMPGVTPWKGKRKPVRLVRAVVRRKRAVTRGRVREASMAKRTMKPAAMPMRLMATCSWVKTERLRPRIMGFLLRMGEARPERE